MPYVHLTIFEREKISQLHFSGISKSEIARQLGRHRGTISRELERNFGNGSNWTYSSSVAQQLAQNRRRQAKEKVIRKLDCRRLLRYVKQKLRLQWSPEQISGRLSRDKSLGAVRISHESIYEFLRRDKSSGGAWSKHLRHSNKLRRKKYGSNLKKYRIQNRTMIDARPAVVARRNRLGDWEGDTMVGRNHQGCLLTQVERKSRFLVAAKLVGRTGLAVNAATIRHLSQLPKNLLKTMTLDNGSEFTHFKQLERRLALKVYFAHPYHSWERGTNENTNGLLRQYFPKQMDLSKISPQALASVVDKLNNRPRKCLNWRTPREVLKSQS